MKCKYYVIQELHYINKTRYFIDIFSNNDLDLVRLYRKALQDKNGLNIYRICEVL